MYGTVCMDHYGQLGTAYFVTNILTPAALNQELPFYH